MADLGGELPEIRADLDRLDEQLVELINDRARLAQRIGQTKAAVGLRVYAPDREREVLDRVCRLSQGPIAPTALRSVYRELMSASLALERAPRIAILGPPGSYSHLAGRRKFGASVEFEPLSSIIAVFDELEHGHAEFALVPVENSIAGGVGETLDALIERDVKICGELNLAVHHHLLGHCPLESVQRVYSKPEVFSQCQTWLVETGLIAKTIPVASSSAAAELASNETGSAAIAGELAAELFELNRIAEYIEDDSSNVTRFLILGKESPNATGSDKTSLVFSVGHAPGMLSQALEVFRNASINLTRIESRPNRGKRWDYYFFVDIEGHADTETISGALSETDRMAQFCKILGSYPATNETV